MQAHELTPILKRMTSVWRVPLGVNADAELAEYGTFLQPYSKYEIDGAFDWLKVNRKQRDWPSVAEIREAVSKGKGLVGADGAFEDPIPIRLGKGLTEKDAEPLHKLIYAFKQTHKKSAVLAFEDAMLLEVTPDKGFHKRPYIRLGLKTAFRADWLRGLCEGPWNDALKADVRFVVL